MSVDNVKDIPGKMYSKPVSPQEKDRTYIYIIYDDDLSLSYCRLGFFYRLERGVFLEGLLEKIPGIWVNSWETMSFPRIATWQKYT